MYKPYTSKLPASSCILGTVLWFDEGPLRGTPCRVVHPNVLGTNLQWPEDSELICDHVGWMRTVTSYRQLWVYRKCRGVWINKKLYMAGESLEVVIGASRAGLL